MRQKVRIVRLRATEDEYVAWMGSCGDNLSEWIRDILNMNIKNHPIVDQLLKVQPVVDTTVMDRRIVYDENKEKYGFLTRPKRGQCRGCSKVKDITMRESDIGERAWLCEECYGKAKA